ncbi:unnamed protein product [Heterobilharzia americana]|nr:unnamed protein product [Heterobilharzia americana]
MVNESAYQLRNSSSKFSRESECDHNSFLRQARRSRRSSSHKENNGSPLIPISPRLTRATPLKSIHLINTIDESAAYSSTPIRRPKAAMNLQKNATRLKPSSSVRSSPVVTSRRTLRRSSRRTIQTVPSAVLQSDAVGDSDDSSSANESQKDMPAVEQSISTFFSPRRFNSTEKDQAAKLKRLNTRRMEFDVQELSQSIGCDPTCMLSNSVLNQSIMGDPLGKLLQLCGQTHVKSFGEYFEHTVVESVVKIGEGVYGEVFRIPKGNVVKIFPVGGEQPVNGEKQMSYRDVYPEVFVSRATVVQGKLPKALVASWHKYENERGSDNECPDFLPIEQQWMVLESEFAGEPLANIKFNNCREARSVIEQIALSLAAAESALQFEHRDLHWHNVLVRPTRQWKLRYRNIVYVDMSESPEIFECEGDYQFDIYRIMRDINRNDWRPFHPVSNLYWLHYLMGKLLMKLHIQDGILIHSLLSLNCVHYMILYSKVITGQPHNL